MPVHGKVKPVLGQREVRSSSNVRWKDYNKKEVSLRKGAETHYSYLLPQMRSTQHLETSLSYGSKNRLKQYQKNLSITRGDGFRNRDSDILNLLRQYALDLNEFDRAVSYLERLKDGDGYPFSRNLKIYSTTEDAMARFADKNHTSFRWNRNYQKSLEFYHSQFSKMRLRPLILKDDASIKNALPKEDTHSGYYYIISGKKYKGENLEGISKVYQKDKEKALSEGSFNKPIMIGFRTQASGEYTDDGMETNVCKHKLRVVSMIDLIQIINELQFSKPIQNYLAGLDYYAGGKNSNDISRVITRFKMKRKYFLSIDYSSFDQTISDWLIKDAFMLLKSAFVLTDEQSKLFDIMVNDFINKEFILSEGTLKSHKGVPSGSMFTQIIDSIVNVLVIRTYFNSINEEVDMMTMGDDNVIFTDAPVTLDNLASYIMKNFGLIIKTDEKTNVGECSKDRIKFLSRYWLAEGQYRHHLQLLSRAIYPERHRDYTCEVKPQHVAFGYILTYPLGMKRLINVSKFNNDFKISKKFMMENVDSRYIPGALAYIKEYT